MTTEPYQATCIADLDEHIVTLANRGELKRGEIVAVWKGTGEAITISGRWQSKGYFAQWCIRWTCIRAGKWFSKGLAGYTGEAIQFDKIKHLPIVK